MDSNTVTLICSGEKQICDVFIVILFTNPFVCFTKISVSGVSWQTDQFIWLEGKTVPTALHLHNSINGWMWLCEWSSLNSSCLNVSDREVNLTFARFVCTVGRIVTSQRCLCPNSWKLSITSNGKRDSAQVVELRTLRWGDNFGSLGAQ